MSNENDIEKNNDGDLNFEELVKIYLTIRTEKEKIEAAWKVQNDALVADMKVLEGQMLDVCNKNNASSMRTNSGTVIRKLTERYTVSDGDGFRKFVLENGLVDLFEARIHQGNFKEFIAEHKDDGLPPGVNVMREFGIVVRKPSN
jgi:predicted DNA binding protein